MLIAKRGKKTPSAKPKDFLFYWFVELRAKCPNLGATDKQNINRMRKIYHWTEVRLYPACKSFQAEVPYPLPDHPSVQRSEQGLRVHLAPGRTLVVQSGGIQRVYPHSAEFIRSSTTEPLVADGTTKANPNRPSCTHSAVAIIERKLRLRRS